MRVRNVKGADAKLAMFPDKVIANPNDYKGKWNNYFKNDNPIYIEIGMGKGKFILEHALRNPDINYIGIEKDISIVYKALVKYLETEEEKRIREEQGRANYAKLEDEIHNELYGYSKDDAFLEKVGKTIKRGFENTVEDIKNWWNKYISN